MRKREKKEYQAMKNDYYVQYNSLLLLFGYGSLSLIVLEKGEISTHLRQGGKACTKTAISVKNNKFRFLELEHFSITIKLITHNTFIYHHKFDH